MAVMAAHEKTQAWWNLCKPMMEPLTTRAAGEFWAGMEQIFHMDKQAGPRT